MNLRHLSPANCIICRYHACYNELPVCRKCIATFQNLITQSCPKCGLAATACQCNSSVRTLFFFNNTDAKKLLYLFKYNGNANMVRFLAELLVKATGVDPTKYDAVTFVPRSKRHIRFYGYDQSKELAKAISKRFDVPLITTLKRLKGKPQKLLSQAQRFKNIKNLYQFSNPNTEKVKKILLVDDICTTGATIEACSAILRKEMGCTVTALVLAKTFLIKF